MQTLSFVPCSMLHVALIRVFDCLFAGLLFCVFDFILKCFVVSLFCVFVVVFLFVCLFVCLVFFFWGGEGG